MQRGGRQIYKGYFASYNWQAGQGRVPSYRPTLAGAGKSRSLWAIRKMRHALEAPSCWSNMVLTMVVSDSSSTMCSPASVACLQHGQDEQAGCLHQLLYWARLLLEGAQELAQNLQGACVRYVKVKTAA